MEQLAEQLEQLDQGNSLYQYAERHARLREGISDRRNAFTESGTDWEGEAADNAYAALAKHREWLVAMGRAAEEQSQRAHDLAEAHRDARPATPTKEMCDEVIKNIIQDEERRNLWIEVYRELQKKSDTIQTEYAKGATLQGVDPPQPPSGAPGLPPVTGNGDPRDDMFHKMNERSGSGSPDGGGGSGSGGGGESPSSSPQSGEPAPTSPMSGRRTQVERQGSGESGSGGSPSGRLTVWRKRVGRRNAEPARR